MKHRVTFGAAMHPRRAIRFPRQRAPLRTARARRLRSQLLDSALAVALGLALAFVLFHGWSGGFRP